MAGLQPTICVPSWNWRLRTYFGPRVDVSWCEIALQIADIQSWNSLESTGADSLSASSESFSSNRSNRLALSRTIYEYGSGANWGVRQVEGVAVNRLVEISRSSQSSRKRKVHHSPSPDPARRSWATSESDGLPSVSLSSLLATETPSAASTSSLPSTSCPRELREGATEVTAELPRT